ncbi:DNA ligase (ATP), partial [Desmophyllum pertusum]
IDQVNKHLDQVAQANVEHKRDDIKKALQLLLRNTSALEQKWLNQDHFQGTKDWPQ